MKIEYNNETIEFTIVYEERETVGIKIDDIEGIIVVVPKQADEKVIIDIVKSKAPLILQKLKESTETNPCIKEKKYENGELFLYLGDQYAIQIIIDESIKKDIVKFKNGLICITVRKSEKEAYKNSMEKFYKKKCRKKILERIEYYQKYFKIKPKEIKIIESKNKWGSCSSNRNINFNWRLIMAPIEVIDYIVVHEMCHLMHMNHSKSFWTLVGKIIPDYKQRSEWLKYNNSRMNI
ncbi:M48 family metallopeptidase [Lutibacter sp. B2]|nr:M48 family metallopeptidase [Lutibacter sp. B2]